MAGYHVKTNWTAPPLSLLTPSNCDLSSQLTVAMSQVIVENTIKQDIPIGLVIQFLRSVIPSNWTDRPSDAELATWYTTQLSGSSDAVEDFWSDTINHAIFRCGQVICSKLGWKGDPDVSGLGMIISYYALTILTLIYCFAILVGELPALNKDAQTARKTSKWLRGFQESVNDFLDGILIFACAMHFAAIVRYADILRDPNSRFTVFGLFTSAFMSTFCVFPALILQSVTDRVRKHWLRIFLWLVIIACVVTLEALYSRVYKENRLGIKDLGNLKTRRDRQLGERIWLETCEDTSLREQLENLLTAGRAVLGINMIWWMWYLVASIVPSTQKDKIKNRFISYIHFQRVQKALILLNCLACIVMMCTFLGFFNRYFNYTSSVAGGSVSKDGNWTFGQILSLATWVPIIVQFLSVSFFGVLVMNAKFSRRYKVVENPEIFKDPFLQKADDQAIYGEYQYSGVEGSRVITDETAGWPEMRQAETRAV